jgi:tRNA (cmo5U34)-methyltransferase
VSDSVSVFAEHAPEYEAERRRLVPCFEQLYGTAVRLLSLREGEIKRVLDLGAGTGLMSGVVLAAFPGAQVVLLDGAAEMLSEARERLADESISTVHADLRDPLPEGPFDAVVSALAIHHLEDPDKLSLFARIREVLRPGGVFVNAEHVAGPTPWLERSYRLLWREACEGAGASQQEIDAAVGRMEMDRSRDIHTQLGWMAEAGLEQCDCFFKQLHFAVLAGWRPAAGATEHHG